ncbi:hypothetical protein J5N97_013573 [Dioscorea zingiberensis]|uniref:Phospholipid-transporting ATPase n=1 Tax=Dioscorea zingiberensis TaxID=325984 RepID=A0A9D5CS47_9LILI|nr:hypothetical protein J5N97_013573 [Dioscorea zingiberensis]
MTENENSDSRTERESKTNPQLHPHHQVLHPLLHPAQPLRAVPPRRLYILPPPRAPSTRSPSSPSSAAKLPSSHSVSSSLPPPSRTPTRTTAATAPTKLRITGQPLSSPPPPAPSFPVPWKHVRAGDIVRVVANESIPCDLALLSTSDPTGAVFVQTINLDGESNLKTRYALQETLHRDPEYWLEYGQEPAAIRCEMPNLNIYGFRANIEIDDRKLPVGPNNILLRGCEIKNTEWAVGVAVYTGMETKVMLNNSGASSKRSRLETRMNREILMLAATMVALCTIVATCTGVWLHQNRDRLDTLPFYRKKDFSGRTEKNYLYNGIGLEILFAFLKSIFSFQNFIPISLYISMEIARVTQSYMMTQDKNMYHEATNTKFQCKALNINEDLGQIKYVFSDKTGTPHGEQDGVPVRQCRWSRLQPR